MSSRQSPRTLPRHVLLPGAWWLGGVASSLLAAWNGAQATERPAPPAALSAEDRALMPDESARWVALRAELQARPAGGTALRAWVLRAKAQAWTMQKMLDEAPAAARVHLAAEAQGLQWLEDGDVLALSDAARQDASASLSPLGFFLVVDQALSFAVRERKAGGGVMITASHNPARWNGFKVKPWFGGSAPPEVTATIENAIPAIAASGRVAHTPLAEAEAQGLVERIDVRNAYLKAIAGFVDMDAIRNAGFNVLIDSMFGAAQGWIARTLADGATRVTEIHGERNPSFPGMRAPEPIAPNLGEQLGILAQGGYDVGLSTDGDADRVGIADERGRFITQLQTMALLVHYLVGVRGERGPMVRSVTMTRMVDRLGERYDCPVYETPVGFVHLGPKMMETDALIAGEESGGYAFRGHIPERDGVLSGLLILEAMVKTGRKPSELLQAVYDEIGTHEYDRVDITLRGDERDAIRDIGIHPTIRDKPHIPGGCGQSGQRRDGA